MILEINMEGIYRQADEVVCKEVGEEIFIVSTNSGIVAKEGALFTVTGTGRLIWFLLDGNNSVQRVVEQVLQEYDAPEDVVRQDTIAFLEELSARGMITD